MITAHNALSIRRRGSSNSGKKDPLPQLGDPDLHVPAGVDTSLERWPLRCAVRSGVRSPGSAPIPGRQLGLDQLLQSGLDDLSQGGSQGRAKRRSTDRQVRIGQTASGPSCRTSLCRSF
jgi:hypothetical protein